MFIESLFDFDCISSISNNVRLQECRNEDSQLQSLCTVDQEGYNHLHHPSGIIIPEYSNKVFFNKIQMLKFHKQSKYAKEKACVLVHC